MNKRLICIFTLAALLLTGCGHSKPNEIVYEYTTQSIKYVDKSYSFKRNLDCLNTTHAQYYFDGAIDDSERRACVEATEQILREIELLEEVPTICVLEKQEPYISGHTLYVDVQDWDTVDFTTMVLLAAAGHCSHYGLAYGYANMLCDRFNWSGVNEGKFILTDDIETYDLSYLCFDNSFTSETNSMIAQLAAVDFANAYIAEYSENELQQMLLDSDTTAGMNRVADALERYYEKNDLIVEISEVRYGFGGTTNDYIVASDFASFYVCKDWTDQSRGINPLICENFLHEAYCDVRDFFEINLNQMSQFQELFALDSYCNDLAVIFTNSTSYGNVSMYYLADHTIYLKSVVDLMHEYIHALTIPSAVCDLDTWSGEGFATYFSVWYDYYSRDFLNQDYNSISHLMALRDKLGRPLDV